MFSIFSERELPGYLSQNSLTEKACISLGDPGRPIPFGIDTLCPRFLRLEFFDVGESDPAHDKERIPELGDIESCIDFYRENANRDFFIHSEAGISRSPAVALGLLYLKTGKEEYAKNELLLIRPRAMPNKRIVLLYDNLLGTDLRTTNYVIWMKRIESMQKTIAAMSAKAEGSVQTEDPERA